MKWFRILFLSFFLCIVLSAIVLESNPGKKFLEKSLLQAIATSGLQSSLQVESISGNLPYQIKFKNVDIQGAHFDEVEANISLIYLIKKELYITSLKATGFRPPEKLESHSNSNFKLPVTITVHSFSIDGDLHLTGDGKLRRDGAGFLHLDATRPTFSNAHLHADLSWDKNLNGKVAIDCDTPTLQVFAPWLKTTQEGALEFHVKAKGSPDEFSGKLNGHFSNGSDWTFHTHFQKDQLLKLDHTVVSSDLIQADGSATLDANYAPLTIGGNFRLNLPQGVILGDAKLDKNSSGLQTQINLSSDEINIEGYELKQAIGSVQGIYANEALIGEAKLKANWLQEDWTASSPIALRPKASLFFDDIKLQSALGTANGNLAYRIPEKDFTGKFTVLQADLRLLNRAHASIPVLYGSGSGSFWFDQTGFYADIGAKQVYYDTAYAETASFYKDPNDLRITVEGGQWKTLHLNAATVDLSQNKLHVNASGLLREPFELELSGNLEKNQFTLEELKGTLASDPISLANPSTVTWGPKFIDVTPLSLQYGDGSLNFVCEQTAKKTDVTLSANKIPLKIFSLKPNDVPVSGKLFIDGSLHEENGQTYGALKGRVHNGLLALDGSPDSLALQGDFEANLQKNHLKATSNLTVNQKPFLAFDFDLPMTIDPHHLEIHPIMDRKVEGALSLHGRVEEVIDFINLGTHRIEGNVDCEMKLKGSLNRPQLEGFCDITDGHYQNYFTGTELMDITGSIKGEGGQLVLQKLTAHDGLQGAITASGTMELSTQKYFPYHVGVEFSKLSLLQLDLVNASAVGKIWIKGNLKGGTATGTTEITDCDISIPNKIPRSFPELKVVYKNAPNPLIINKQKEKKPYPLNLDLRVLAPKGININGRGLHSEWKGDFAIGGNYTTPTVNGKLELVQGEFLFSGKQFKLLNGSIEMPGKAYEMPNIDIAANTSEKGISITARIKGPINTPQITFQSSPPMPLSSIVSYLIFGKDLSDVSGLQALQLAGTIASVAGEGPDILEMTRKSLGVDRLQIVMTPSSMDEGADTISLEVGKVIFPGFLVSIRQGAEDDSPNMRIEVDLTHGFTLGLESEQQPEQGKFSLNWNINY